VAVGEVHPQPYIIPFGKVEKKYFMPVGPTKIKDCAAGFEKQHFAASRGGGSTTVEHDSTVALFTKVNSFFFVLKNQCEKFSFFSPKN
jgi:hypothetical protein